MTFDSKIVEHNKADMMVYDSSDSTSTHKVDLLQYNIIEQLNRRLSPSATQAIEFYLQNNMKTSLMNILEEPEKIKEGLFHIFDECSYVMERELISIMSKKFGLQYNYETDFVTYMTSLKRYLMNST